MFSQAVNAYAEELGVVTLLDGEEIFPEEIYAIDPDDHFDWYQDPAEIASKYSGLIDVSPSEYTEFAIKIPVDGIPVPFGFPGREYLRIPYDIQTRRMLLFCGRQVEKSTLIGNSILATMCIIPHFRALYVSPTHEQTKVFRRDRIGEPILLSDILQAFLSTKYANNIALIKFVNFAQLTLRYAYLTADRVRGIPADRVYIDEIQDILTDNLPVIEECAGHANPALKSFVYSGTPKSFDNTIEQLWSKRSTQNEWAVPCTCKSIFDMKPGNAEDRSSVEFWNAPLSEDNMGMEGLICAQCGKRISAADHRCHWVSMNPSLRSHPTLEPFESFRIPQLMVPWIDWSDILNKRESYSRARFFNEVLAQSFESGSRPLRMEDIIRNCRESIQMCHGEDHMLYRCAGVPLFMGIDWGNENSKTVVTIGGYLEGPSQSGQFSIIHARRYTGQDEDPELHIEDVIRLIEKYRPMHVGVDYGGGFDRNTKLIKRFGMQRILRYQYIGGHAPTKRGKIQYDTKKGRYMLDRTEVMADIFTAIKDNKLAFPSWAEWYDPFAMDMLNIFSEYNEITRMTQYDKSPGMTDDTFHSVLYCLFASMVRFPRMDILRPMKEAPGIQ